ncbi:hypothetical protein N9M21_04930 [Alphaproteobacteria bacterium]|nr:hypothetical protein [Alphaproteobacteria bacterium]
MVENNTEATIIDADAEDVTEASAKKPMNLSLIVAVLALVVSAIALIFVIRESSDMNASSSQGTFDSIEARLQAIEAAPASASGDTSLLEAELAAVKSDIEQVEADLAATVTALNGELDRVSASVESQAPAAAAVASAPVALSASGLSAAAGETLDALDNKVAALAETMDGSLARISKLSADMANGESVVSALSERLNMAEGTLEALPNQLSDQFGLAIDEVKQNSASQLAGLKTSLDESMNALSDLSSQTDQALAETRATIAAQVEESAAGLSERLAGVQSAVGEQVMSLSTTLDEAKAATADQLAAVGATMSGLNDEFVAMKEVSVETSTKVLAVNQLRDALASSAPVRPHMTSLSALNPTEDALLGVLATVDTIADDRVPTQKILVETIAALSPKLVNETRINSADGRGGKILARLGSLVTVERIEDIETIPGIEGNMARAAARVAEGDFEAALTELQDDSLDVELSDETQARFDGLVTDMGNRATYEEQRRVLGDWVTTTLNSARATASN